MSEPVQNLNTTDGKSEALGRIRRPPKLNNKRRNREAEHEISTANTHGVVQWYSAEKGYGMIRVDPHIMEDDVYFASAMADNTVRNLTAGDVVRMDLAYDSDHDYRNNGYYAVNIVREES